MSQQSEKPLYWDNHEAFPRLLIQFGVTALCGVLIAGWPLGILAHYWVYSRPNRSEG